MSLKHDYMARRLNFDEEADNSVIDLCLSSDEDGDECPTDDTFNDTPFINLDDTDTFSGTSLLESLLPFEPLAEVGDFEPTTPPPTPTSLDHTIMYGEGLLQ